MTILNQKVLQNYYRTIAERGFSIDAAQIQAIQRLQTMYDEWVRYAAHTSHYLKRWLVRPKPPRGVYLWGGVGRGKSFIMDSFYSIVPIPYKTRVHFHAFMRHIHRQLNEVKDMPDPLMKIAKQTAKKYRLICFDEFHVNDIADAMMLYNLLSALFSQGVSFVITSNYPPEGLYPDGLHRDRFLPAIDLLQAQLESVNVDSGTDYRQRASAGVQVYYTPLSVDTDRHLLHAFHAVAEMSDELPEIEVEGHHLRARCRAGGVIWFDFKTLCGGPRSQNDYLEIAQRFHTVILSDIPQMSAAMSDQARRFTWLIDVFYEQKTRLIMSSTVAPEALYKQGVLANEFHRTVSRIMEMQSRHYHDTAQKI